MEFVLYVERLLRDITVAIISSQTPTSIDNTKSYSINQKLRANVDMNRYVDMHYFVDKRKVGMIIGVNK